MIKIKVPSQQRYTRVDVSSTGTNNTYLIFAYDFKTLTKEEKRILCYKQTNEPTNLSTTQNSLRYWFTH